MHDPYGQLPSSSALPPVPSSGTSDEAYVARIARKFRWWDRWRLVVILLHVGIVAGGLWLGIFAVDLIKDFQVMLGNQNQNVMPESVVIIGIMLGVKVGVILQNSVLSVLNALTGSRTERLLVQHFKAPATSVDPGHGDHDANTSEMS